MPFDISKFAQGFDVSDSDTELREIFLDKIRENPENFYPPIPKTDQEELEDSIEANGLLEPLVVVSAGEQYRLISGHNRLRALRQLNAKSDGKAYTTALCRVLPPMDEAAELAAIIEFNRQRKKTPAILADEARRLTESYRKRIDAGEKLPGRIRDRVAAKIGVSPTKLGNLSAIKNGLACDDFREAWEHGQITESCALEIARMDPREQEQLDDWLAREQIPCTLRTVREFAVIGYLVSRTCDKAGKPCPNARAMYAAFSKDGELQGCCGCCDRCLQRDTCDTCCNYVERWPTNPDCGSKSECGFGYRLKQARERAGLTQKELGVRMGVTGSNVGQYETGIRSPKLETVQKFAETVDVDVSELLDFHGPAQPEGQLTIAGWMPGSCNPAEPGEFAVLVDVGQAKYFRTFMAWDGDGWLMLPSRQQAEILPSWWLRLPPEPEKGETT